MKEFGRLFIIGTTCLLAGCGTTGEGTGSKPAISVTIPYGSLDALQPFRPYSRRGNRFYVLLTNVSSKPVSMWQEWCSWGYYCLQLEVSEQDGTKHLLKKKPTDFYANFPDSLALQPGESVVWSVSLYGSEWSDLSWLPKGRVGHVKVRAIYTVNEDKDSREQGVWTGQAISEMYDFILQSAITAETK